MNVIPADIKFGIERFGRLRRVLLHRPEKSITLVTEENKEFFLFDKVPDVDRYLEEHMRYEALLKSQDIEVHMLSDHISRNTDLLDKLPNLAYLHDIAVISSKGAIISKMSSRGRCHEEIVVKEALTNLGVPVLYEPFEGEDFEGCLLVSPRTIFVANTERHSRSSIEKFITFILLHFEEIIYAEIPKERRFMHPDMVLNRITENLMVYYPPAFLKTFLITKEGRKEIDIKKHLNSRKVDMVKLSDLEQRRWGSSFVPLEPGVIINYDISLNENTISILEKEGVRFIHFHPDALLAGGGSLRCLTMRIWRET